MGLPFVVQASRRSFSLSPWGEGRGEGPAFFHLSDVLSSFVVQASRLPRHSLPPPIPYPSSLKSPP